jgi:hypothetical protein
VYQCTEAWEIVFVGFLVRHLLVLVTVVGNFHAVDRCDSLAFSTEQLSERKQGLYYTVQQLTRCARNTALNTVEIINK